MNEKLYYTYNEIHNIINSKKDIIKEFNADIILAIGGGGLIPARMIRSYINKPILVVTLDSYNDENIKDEINIIQWITKDLSNKRVLIIDEIDDTRRTLKYCIDELKRKNNARDIGVFVVHNKVKKKYSELHDYNIEYITGQNIEDKWVVYPWDSIYTM